MTNTRPTQCPHCEMNLTPYHDPARPLRFCVHCHFPLLEIAGKYRLIDILGKGGFGTVYRAQHTLIKRDSERVIKVLKPDLIDKPGMKPRFLREVQLTSILSQNNPHIVRVFDDFGEVPDLGYFYVMEYLRGLPLTHYLRATNAPLPLDWSLEVFAQICDAMQAAHCEGVIHRDIKPDNIVLLSLRGRDNFVKVIDFGIAKPLLSETLQSGSLEISTKGILGTPFYIAPEQAMNQKIGPHTDLYAMAVLLHEMLTGELPLIPPSKRREVTLVQILQMRLENETIPPPSQVYPHLQLPQAFDAIFQKALHRNPHKRYRSAEAFWEVLAPFYQGAAPPPTFATKPIGEPDGPAFAYTRPQEQAIDSNPTLVSDAFDPFAVALDSSTQQLSQSDRLSTNQAQSVAYASTIVAPDLDSLDFKKTEPTPLPTPFDEHTFLGEIRPTTRKNNHHRILLLLLVFILLGALSAAFLRTHLVAFFHPPTTVPHGSVPSTRNKLPDLSASSNPPTLSHSPLTPDIDQPTPHTHKQRKHKRPRHRPHTRQQPAPRSDPQPDPQPAPRPAPRPDPQPAPQPAPRPDPQPDPQPDPRPNPRPPPAASLCPSPLRFVRITPFRPNYASIHLRPHANLQKRTDGICIPRQTTLLLIEQTGFQACQATLPSFPTAVHLRLRDDSDLAPNYCIYR